MDAVHRARVGPLRGRIVAALALIAAALGLVMAPAAGAAPPLNDNRADAEPIPAFPVTIAGTTGEATLERLDPQVSKCGPIESTVWYRISPAPDGTLILNVRGDGLAPVIRVYTLSKTGIDELVCGSAEAGQPAQALFAATRGANYLVVVGKRPGTSDAAFVLEATQTLPPANDSRGQAAPLGKLPVTITGSTIAATYDGDTDSDQCGLAKGGSVWYSLDPAGADRIRLGLRAAAGIDLGLAVFVRTRSQVEELGCRATDRNGALDAAFDTVKGSTYLIMVGTRKGSQPGAFTIEGSAARVGAVDAAEMIYTRPPSNDVRGQAKALVTIPATVSGSTVAATADPETDSTECGLSDGASVWYALTPGAAKRILLELKAGRGLDLGIAVFARSRSQVEEMGCRRTDRDGRLSIAFDTEKGVSYLVMVGTVKGSKPGEFVLDASFAEPRETTARSTVGPAGITGKVDWITDVNDLYAATLRAGVTYRIALVSDGAVLDVKGPRGKLLTFRTSGYRTFTPGPASQGRYTFDVVGPEDVGAVEYRLTVAPAVPDDVGAGIVLAQATPSTGSIAPALADVVDVYHFVVTGDRSNIRVTLETRPKSGVSMTLVGPSGEKVATVRRAVERLLPPGRYLVTVQGTLGKKAVDYTIAYAVRQKTIATISAPQGELPANVRPEIRVAVAPAPTTGSVVVRIERHDETDGWVFAKRVLVPVPGGLVPWRPTEPGRWRVSAHYPGALAFSASSTKVHEFTLVRARELPPGKPLARSGVSGRVDWKSDVNDVYWTHVEAGTTYLVAFTSGCARVTMTTPDGETAKLSCNGFRAFTPGPAGSGRVVLDVTAPEDRGATPYRLVVVPAGADDIGLGRPFRNLDIVRGTLDPAGADVVDLYRFTLADDRSDVRLRLTSEKGSGIAMTLMTESGARAGASPKVIKGSLRAGTFVVAVRGTMGKPGGAYTLRLIARHYTSTTLTVGRPEIRLGETATARVVVTPSPAAGTLDVRLDRYDPSLGWVYTRTLALAPSGGWVSWAPTIAGRYRLRAVYSGSIEHTPSASATATLVVTDTGV